MCSDARDSRRRATSQRTLWGLADQVLSSGTNFALTLVAARGLPVHEFGAFAIVIAGYILANGVVRGLVAEPLLVRFSNSPAALWHDAVAGALRGSLSLGLVISGSAVAVATFAPSVPNRGAVVLLAVLFPGLLLQDTGRYAVLARGTPKPAVTSDLVWAVVLFAAIAALTPAHTLTLVTLVAAWGGAGIVAGVVLLAQVRIHPFTGQPSWLRQHGRIGTLFAADFVMSQGAGQLALFALGGLAGAADAGAFRAAQAAFGPLVVLFVGARLAVLPELVRIRDRSPQALLRAVAVLCLALTVIAVALGVAVYALPHRYGAALFGSTWTSARPLVPLMAVVVAGGGAETGAVTGIRALADAAGGLRVRVVVGVVTVVASVVGAWEGGAMGAVTALAVTAPPAFLLWWWQFRRSLGGVPAVQHRYAVS